jgi:hypothetical protein
MESAKYASYKDAELELLLQDYLQNPALFARQIDDMRRELARRQPGRFELEPVVRITEDWRLQVTRAADNGVGRSCESYAVYPRRNPAEIGW